MSTIRRYFSKLSIQERARRDIEQHRRDLYDAEKNVALWRAQVELHKSEILRLKPIQDALQ